LTQFWWNITAEPLPEPLRQEFAVTLSPAERELFYHFQESDQWHAYRVYNTLKETGQSQPDLLAAALLHDVGKTKVDLSVWDRILIVLTELLKPGKVKSWGQGDLQSWKRPFVVRLRHAQWGAEMAQSAGSSPLTIDLIRRHQDPVPEDSQSVEDDILRLLQWADDLN
jgi:hypothetical protein